MVPNHAQSANRERRVSNVFMNGPDHQPPGQLPFDLPHRTALDRNDFWVGKSNSQAVTLIDDWPDWQGAAAMLIGPRGSGKTHLAEVWRKRSGALRIAADELTIESVPELLSKSALVVEDAPGAHLDEHALFHLLNFAREQSAHVLLTARDMPSLWEVALPDLLSRLNALSFAQMMEPDDVLLRAVLMKLFTDRQVKVDDPVLDYLVVHMERSLGVAHDLVARLDARALAEKTAITRPFAARILKEFTSEDGPQDMFDF